MRAEPHSCKTGIELLAVNGEDHYGASGELDWLAANEGRLDDVVLALDIDGAGLSGWLPYPPERGSRGR